MSDAGPGRGGIGGRLLAGAALAAALITAIPAAMAQDATPPAKSDAPALKIELNRLEPASRQRS